MLSYLLLVDGDALEGLLDDPTAVHLQGKLLDVGSELQMGEDSYFIMRAKLKIVALSQGIATVSFL